MMAKVHPKASSMIGSSSSSSISSCCQYTSLKREVFTVWMKSLVFNGYGCTVFNSKGQLVFRVDNYQTRSCTEVLLMDFTGQVLFSITTKKLLIIFRSWEVHKWKNSKFDDQKGEWFKVIKRKGCKVFTRRNTCQVFLRCQNKTSSRNCSLYKIVGSSSTLKILDCADKTVAEMMKKQSVNGVFLGDDVVTLMVEPLMDQSLMVALFIAHAIINHKL